MLTTARFLRLGEDGDAVPSLFCLRNYISMKGCCQEVNIEKTKYMFDYNEINCNSVYKINSINSFSDTKSISYKSESIITEDP